MRPEDFDKAKNLINQTHVLSQLEKTEWIQLLPKMNDKQVLELIEILTPVPAKSEPPKPITPPWELQVNPKEKELGTSRPSFEPELPPAPKPQAATAPAPKPSTPAGRSPEELQKLVEQIANHKPNQPEPVPAPKAAGNAPTPAGQAILNAIKEKQHHENDGDEGSPEHIREMLKNGAAMQPAVAKESGAKSLTAVIPLKTQEDFGKLTASMLHGRDPVATLQSILNDMAAVSQSVHSFQVVSNFQKSPLNKSYVEFGLALLNDPNEDRNIAFDNVSRDFKAKGKEYMTKQEFEVFTDFRSQVDKLFL